MSMSVGGRILPLWIHSSSALAESLMNDENGSTGLVLNGVGLCSILSYQRMSSVCFYLYIHVF
jgi:hypothetical protein